MKVTTMNWVRVLVAALLFAGTSAMQVARAQAFPARPVHLIVPYAPGAGADLMARVAAIKLGENLKQAVVVDAKPGGDTMIGTRAARAAARSFGALLLAGALAAGASAQTQSDDRHYSPPLREAIAAYRAGDLDTAEKTLRTYAAGDPDHDGTRRPGTSSGTGPRAG